MTKIKDISIYPELVDLYSKGLKEMYYDYYITNDGLFVVKERDLQSKPCNTFLKALLSLLDILSDYRHDSEYGSI